MILQDLKKKKLIAPPSFLIDNTHYLTVMGSEAYGVSQRGSDIDLYGFTIPHKTTIFPHLAGHIQGFGQTPNRFDQWQQHHIKDGEKEYDITVYNIVKYFQLCMENNPNMIDSLFTPRTAVIHMTQLGQYVRDNRKLFLHKGSKFKFSGYAYSQMHKIRTKKADPGTKRAQDMAEHGYSLKFAYHTVRLLLEGEQILTEGDLDLTRNKELLKSIRRGEWSLAEVEEFFKQKEHALDVAYTNSKLPHSPRIKEIKQVLLDALEMHFGTIEKAETVNQELIRELKDLVKKYE